MKCHVSVGVLALGAMLAHVDAAMADEDDQNDGALSSTALEAHIAELEAQLAVLSERMDEDELQAMLERAELATMAPPEETRPEDRVFLERSRAMQAANPEISVSGDLLAELPIGADFMDGRPTGIGMPIRAMGLNFQSVLDPYSVTKIAVEFFPDPEEPVNLEECYITYSGLVPSLSFTFGRFRQQFGVLNRWHEHDLDQTNYPEAVFLMGDAGLLGNGIAVKWFMPRIWAHAQELSLEVVDGDNPWVYSGDHLIVPSGMARLKSYWDLSEDTYLEWGLSGAAGLNSSPVTTDATWGHTLIAGTDLTLFWNPLSRAKYASFTWRSEGFMVQKETPTDGWDRALGAYSYVQTQVGAKWFMGLRGDWIRPIPRDYAYFEGDFARDDLWRAVPYATFWQSEFVYLRFEYWATLGLDDTLEHRALLQLSWAAGPHKHEKY